MNQPNINVTPLIDVLLVLLIIFMVITPLQPHAFKARIPAEPDTSRDKLKPHPDTLLVSVSENGSLALNQETGLGTVAEPGRLIERLKAVFAERAANGSPASNFADDGDRPTSDRIERTVFIKASRSMAYGPVASVVDAAKLAGAFPISLQVDALRD